MLESALKLRYLNRHSRNQYDRMELQSTSRRIVEDRMREDLHRISRKRYSQATKVTKVVDERMYRRRRYHSGTAPIE